MRIGIFSGSFNPVHLGHVALSEWFVKERVVDEVWLVCSPMNPLKADRMYEMAADADRQAMLRLAIQGCNGLRLSTIEDDMPRPSYSIHTLRRLRSLYPEHEFHFIMGSDNWQRLHRWYKWDELLREFHVVVYPRKGYNEGGGPDGYKQAMGVRQVDAPVYEVSSTQIRQWLVGDDRQVNEARRWLCPAVFDYIMSHGLYRR